MKKVAIVGTQGVPANYGGFESLVENIINNNSKDVQYTVFCSSKDLSTQLAEYKGAQLKYISLSANGTQSVLYDMLSLLRLPKGTDVVLILGVSGCLLLPLFKLFSKTKCIVNIDGVEHRREKWGKFAKAFLKLSERMAVKYADIIISDNKGIQDYVREEYGKESVHIAYGGDHAIRTVSLRFEQEVLDKYSLHSEEYAITVCRIEPENNCHQILEAFSRTGKKLIFIGNWNHCEYGRNLKNTYSHFPNIQMLYPIYDIDILYVLRKNASMYVHGHSAGGTNPSLVEALFFGRPILCYDVIYNRKTTQAEASYWNDANELITLLHQNHLCGESMKTIAQSLYTWKKIIAQYEDLY